MINPIEGGQQERLNLNRGYQKLRVWQDSISLFTLILEDFRGFSFMSPSLHSEKPCQAFSHPEPEISYPRSNLRGLIPYAINSKTSS